MLSEIGIWDNLVRENMPDSSFLIQNDQEALGELIEASNLPNFATDITIRTYENMQMAKSAELRQCLRHTFPTIVP